MLSMVNFNDPLEQFKIFKIFGFQITNLNFNLLVICEVIGFLFLFFSFSSFVIYNNQIIKNAMFDFVKNIIKDGLSVNNCIYLPILYLTFIFIILCNLIGMIPYAFTLTSSFIITLFIMYLFQLHCTRTVL